MSLNAQLVADMTMFLADFGEDVIFTAPGQAPVTIQALIDRSNLIPNGMNKGRTLTWKIMATTSIADTPLSSIPNKSATMIFPRRVGESPHAFNMSLDSHDAGAVIWGCNDA